MSLKINNFRSKICEYRIKMLSLPCVIAEVNLRAMDGKIKKTFKNSHYSWWRSKAFDIKKAKTIEL